MFDGLLAGIIARQLNSELTGAKIEKIQQPEPDEIIIQVNSSAGRKKLLLSVNPQGARVHYTTLPYENPAEPPAFCMLLRKHLQGGRIISISQVDTERIINIDMETVNEMGFSVYKRLIAETMGKHSNLILLDVQSGKIIDSIKRISIDVNRYRQILPGQIYILPPSQDKISFWDGGNQGIVGEVAREYDTGKKLEQLRSEIIEGKICPAVFLDESGAPKDVHAVLLPELAECMKVVQFDEIGQALDYYFSKKTETNRVMQKGADLIRTLNNLIDKQLLKKQRLSEELQAAEESDIYRIKGELLNANLHRVKAGDKCIRVISYYDGSEIEISLDERFSAAKNAQNYFKKYSKLKSSAKEKRSQLKECEAEISYLESVQGLAASVSTHEEIELLRNELILQGHLRGRKAVDRKNGKSAKPKPRRFTTAQGYEVAIGRSNTENDYITFKLGGKTDLWFHAKDIPGSHVLLFTGGCEPDADTIYEVAAIAAFYSKAKDSENVPVDYVPLRYVKKPAGAKPGMVVFTNNRTVWINPKEPNIH